MNSTMICERLRDPSIGLPVFAFIIGHQHPLKLAEVPVGASLLIQAPRRIRKTALSFNREQARSHRVYKATFMNPWDRANANGLNTRQCCSP